MSRVIENQCVDCGLPCLGSSCPYQNVEVIYCDECGESGAIYNIDGKDMCESCARQFFRDIFDDKTVKELGNQFDIHVWDI